MENTKRSDAYRDGDYIAVVILNWNGESMLRSFLPSVVRYSQQEGVVVYVADNGSTDKSCEVVETEFPSVRLIRLECNYGFAEGYCKALEQIKATYYVLLNSDVEVTENWLEPMRVYMDAHDEVGACQPKLLSWHEKDRFEYAGACGGYIDKLGYPYCRGRIFGVVEKDTGQYDTVAPVFWASGAALMIRAKDYRECGGLDGTFFAHMEEIDLCWRLHLIGKQVVCIPQSKVYHVGGATLNKESPRKTYLNFRNNLFMLYKNLPASELYIVLLMRAALDYLAAFVFLLDGQAAHAKAVCNARIDFWRMRRWRKEARRKVWEREVKHLIPEQFPFSILWCFHIKGIKRFSALR